MKIYNTLSRTIEEFIPIDKNEVKMYTCGPTVYNFAHIGNLRSYIHEDILEKTFIMNGFNVNRTLNITDVGHLESDADDGDDKMLKGAIREKLSVEEIAKKYTNSFFKDLKLLNIKRPKNVKNATWFISDYIEYIKVLEEKGFTYFSGGNVYFDISKFPEYTNLSKLSLDNLKIASREDVSIDNNKKNPQDFVLWFTKSKFENQAQRWDSPWGEGYPGWHIECSVIALKTLGNKLDIHCGGVDHINIHHTNEIAQSEAFLGEKWCNYWWHNEFLLDETGKMSKSSGEFLTLQLLIDKGFNPLSYRYYILNSHYRKQLSFNFEKLESAQNAYFKLREKCNKIIDYVKSDYNEFAISDKNLSDDAKELKKNFENSINDDLNTANAITVMYEIFKSNISEYEKYNLLCYFDEVLSLDLVKPFENVLINEVNDELKKWIEEMIEQRNIAKSEKNYRLADDIRNALLEKNIILKDTKERTIWELKK